MTGPKPIENRRTFTPSRLAVRKCPHSWTNTSTPNATTNAIVVTTGSGIVIYTSVAEHGRVVIREHEREQETVQPVQDATVTRDNPAGVFRPERALERGLAEIPELCQRA